MNNQKKVKEWSKNISNFNKSGKSKQDWCEENNISGHQFGYWYGRLGKNQAKQWLPVKIQEDKVENIKDNLQEEKLSTNLLNIKIGRASIEVQKGFDKELLLDILKTLKLL